MTLAIGIDLGGTNIKAALIDCATGAAVATLSKPTRDGEFVGDVPRFAVTVREIVEELESEAGAQKLDIGLSAPGLADPSGRCIRLMPGRMHGLEQFDWSAFLDRRVNVLNDAHSALLGEVWIGAAQGCNDAFMLTLGTGVGGAVFAGGRLLKGMVGRAGHLGHITVDAMAPTDDFNTPGSLEDAIGNQTIAARGQGKYATTLELISKVAAGDADAAAIWLDSVLKLAAAVASLINVLDPEVVIIGGGIASGAGPHLFEPLGRFLDQFEWRPAGHAARIVPAMAGDMAGCFGAVRSLLEFT
ncbi:MAG: ROK family protein [Verrucomicrobiaceae bacterium]|nr:ROK family protein [Verrucomicrobiaceae bacterium]